MKPAIKSKGKASIQFRSVGPGFKTVPRTLAKITSTNNIPAASAAFNKGANSALSRADLGTDRNYVTGDNGATVNGLNKV